MREDYKFLVNKELFSEEGSDKLFKSEIKPYLKDKTRYLRAKEMLGYPESKDIFEIGVYPGTGIYYFGEDNNIVGFGKSDPVFTDKISKLGHSIVEVDFESAGLNQYIEKADIVLCMEVLEHIRNPYYFLKTIMSLVKPAGYLYLTTNNQYFVGYLLKLLLKKTILDPIETESSFYPGHCRYYSLKELSKIFQNENFKIISAKNINFLPKSKFYNNRIFGVLKNFIIKISPISNSTHIEFLIQRKI